MKVLIWVLGTLAISTVITLFKYGGIILGGIPTAIIFGVGIWAIRKLCKDWDERHGRKKREEDSQEPEKNDLE